jgi:hypothetical protein
MLENKKTKAKKNNALSEKRKATLQNYVLFSYVNVTNLPQNLSKDTLNDVIKFARMINGKVYAWYDKAKPKEISNIDFDEKTFQSLKQI